MIKVAFIGNYTKEWVGGINYLSNLLYAISQLEDKKIEPIVFLGKKVEIEIIQKFQPYAQIVQDSLFDRKSFKWILSKILENYFNTSFLTTRLLRRHNIQVLSHSSVYGLYDNFIKINWIPDFQHIRLPDFFSNDEVKKRDSSFFMALRESQNIIVSSYDAYKDCKDFSPKYIDKVKVLQFVSQPAPIIFDLDKKYIKKLEDKYQFRGRYFYLPNQFWKHKNHKLVFEAIKLLKNQGIEALVLCSGHMIDYRHPDYIEIISDFIKKNNLEENIKLLGLIDYSDVLYFMRYSIAVINPSLFEGWSSTVEECKSVGKNMILSDISIHKEQNPPESLFFNPYDAQSLSMTLKKVWMEGVDVPNKKLEKIAKKELKKRTLKFAKKYQNILLEAIEESKI